MLNLEESNTLDKASNNTKLTWALVLLSFSILAGSYLISNSIKSGVPIYSAGVEDAIRSSIQEAVNTNYQLNQDILNLSQAAAYLQIPQEELTDLAVKDEIPHVKIKQQIIFSKHELNNWVSKSNFRTKS